MGHAAYMNVQNTTGSPITTLVNNVNCYYNGGANGSNPNLFNNATIAAGQTFPGGMGQYIEAQSDAFSGCAAHPSSFVLKIEQTGEFVSIVESHGSYSATQASTMNVNIDNGSPNATILVTVFTPGYDEAAALEASSSSSS